MNSIGFKKKNSAWELKKMLEQWSPFYSLYALVDGSYNDWSAWTTCSMSCGGGVKFRHRNCTNPEPMHGGRDCSLIGPATESDSCHSEPCPGRCIQRVFNFHGFSLSSQVFSCIFHLFFCILWSN